MDVRAFFKASGKASMDVEAMAYAHVPMAGG